MNVHLVLDKHQPHFTNLDVISGRVVLRSATPSSVSSIVVKLEGEARTRLLSAVRLDRPDRQHPVIEVHKVLYKTQTVFPSQNSSCDVAAQPKTVYTLNAGQYEYPFEFKIPINNACTATNSLVNNLNLRGLAVELARAPTYHVKQTLPPSLTGFPGEAEIRYFVKVTVQRPGLFKENPRAWANFTFLPIEPPRSSQSDGEAYARRHHQFLENPPGRDGRDSRKFSLGKSSKSDSSEPGTSLDMPPRFTVDVRLPNPAVLTCNQDLPLRILVKNMSQRPRNVYLQMLQIELLGYTKVRAHEVHRTESSSWVIATFSNMAIPLGTPTDAVGTEVPINPEYWSGSPLPNSVAPTFTACNLTRFYELEVRVGLGYGSYEYGKDQLIVLPLRLPVQVYSGIAPPPELLTARASSAAAPPPVSTREKPSAASLASSASLQPPAAPAYPHTPTEAPGFAGHQAFPPQEGVPEPAPHEYDDAPPSYEDAVGANLPPINGYRGSYRPPPQAEGAGMGGGQGQRQQQEQGQGQAPGHGAV